MKPFAAYTTCAARIVPLGVAIRYLSLELESTCSVFDTCVAGVKVSMCSRSGNRFRRDAHMPVQSLYGHTAAPCPTDAPTTFLRPYCNNASSALMNPHGFLLQQEIRDPGKLTQVRVLRMSPAPEQTARTPLMTEK